MDMNTLFSSLIEVTIVGILLGAGLPALFALGIRLAHGSNVTTADGMVTHNANPLGKTAAGICFAIIIFAVLIGILWVTKSTIHQYFNLDLFGTES
ncbi:hypothetical protein COCCU_02110 [Corynebacterium occultum]|uniref:Uncharacterized protein n=1 Tax=Corynebacterium occultum TaxID=2675219 RepID=A0A6B8W1K2_9CORY|nr:hypothetical protein [Corynebacterium occultum]QGU06381.1 hypothetical protein COCCU_02110 [Corynebacterium occultum]